MLSVNFVSALQSAFKIPELRARIVFVFAMFTVYAVGLHIPIPGVDREVLRRLFEDQQLLEFLNMFTGGALRKLTILALGLNPYITASIIMQIFSYADPRLREAMREEAGRRLMQQRTRLLTIAIALVQSIGLIATFRSAGALELSGVQYVQVVVAWIAGAMFLLWLGEQITEKGLGNGVSLMIFASIVASMPYQITRTYQALQAGAINFGQIVLLLAIFVATVWGIVYRDDLAAAHPHPTYAAHRRAQADDGRHFVSAHPRQRGGRDSDYLRRVAATAARNLAADDPLRPSRTQVP
jgi:preprotein translocase subunit SecY